MKKIPFAIFIGFLPLIAFSQVLFEDTFTQYQNFTQFKLLNENFLHWWSTHNTEFGYDFNRNQQLDTFEFIKHIEIATNLGRHDSKSMKFRFKRLNPNIVSQIIYDYINGTIAYEEYVNLYNKFTRNEISSYIDATNTTTYLPNTEYWFKFSVYIDNDYEFELGNSSNTTITNTNIDNENIDIISQWHFEGNPSAPPHPPISLQIVKNKWVLVRYPIDISYNDYQLNVFVIGNVEKGVWTDWKFNIKFSSSNNGKIKIWKNGSLVYSDNNTTTIFQNYRLFWKIGIYKPHWWSRRTTTVNNERCLYFDDIKIYQNLSLIDSDCGKTLDNSNMSITTNTVEGNPKYHFRIDSQNSSNHVYSYSPTIDLKKYNWIEPNTHYYVKVKIDEETLLHYGEYADFPCEIWTPDHLTIGLIRDDNNNCNKHLSSSDMTITSETVAGNPLYHFRIDSQNSSNHVYSYSPTIDLRDYVWVRPNTHYYVKVKIDGNPINKFGEYNNTPCEIWTPNNWWTIHDTIHMRKPISTSKSPIVFPNPISNNTFNILISNNEKILRISIFSIKNQRTIPFFFNKTYNSVSLLPNIEPGIYICNITTKENIYIVKIIKL